MLLSLQDGLLTPLSAMLKTTGLKAEEQASFEDIIKKQVESCNHLRAASVEKLVQFINSKEKKGLLVVNPAVVPEQIVGVGRNFAIKDVKVKCRGPDDKIYAQNPDIQRFVPRGLTLLCYPGDSNDSAAGDILDPIIYANRKFTGGIGDEDEEQPNSNEEWKQYFLAVPETASLVVAIEKVNGEAAHFSGRFMDGKFCIFTGSKNVHMLIHNEDDIKYYEGDRYSTARTVATTVMRTLAEMEESKRSLLQYFLHYTRFTITCELAQPEYQHVVLLDHLERPVINVFAAYDIPEDFEAPHSLTAVPMHFFLSFVKALGLQTPTYTILPSAQDDCVRDFCRQVRKERCCEGRVLYYMKDAHCYTIGLCKIKTVWYIIIRAIREKACFWLFKLVREPDQCSQEDMLRSTHKRINQIKDWLQLSQACVNQWKDLGERFLRWCWHLQQSESSEFSVQKLRPEFPRWWKKFIDAQPVPEGRVSADDIPPFDD
ncbi:uncharacterized protein LOC108671217 [Hyalella azteca]|uniref:Uncharacterized protein LOC108671217 n=1 Tax=Hyalella azteca TaxID=294128 RepID=A0A8B7NKM6_HYAAZ|nr:uncharacterized protein LOC108671217 [Hyalella azteca]